MKPDLANYPEIPLGCLINENKHFNLFQIYRNVKVTDANTGKSSYKRETVGSIKDGVFTFSKTYLLKQKNKELSSRILGTEDTVENIDSTNTFTIDGHTKVHNKLEVAIKKTAIDKREPIKIEVPMVTIVLGSMMSALTENTGCTEISDAINTRLRDYFLKYIPSIAVASCSHDTVRKALLLLDADSLWSLYTELIASLKQDGQRVIAADGQAIRATGKTTADNENKHGAYMLMNFYDATNRICLYHKLIDKKENEISVGPDALQNLNLQDAVVTADAMSCQINFVETVIKKGAHYCISLKGNQEKSFDEVRCLFNSVGDAQIIKYEPSLEKDHGRLEEYKIYLLRGSWLSPIIKEKWLGLEGGSLAKVERKSIKVSTKKETWEERYYITSIPASKENAPRVAEVIRQHWGIENQLHWCLDVRFNQDRMQANNPNYIANRSALNKLALAYLQNYRYWLWDHGKEKNLLSINILQKRCSDPKIAMECIACGLGVI